MFTNHSVESYQMVDERNTGLMRDYVRETTTSVENGSEK